MLAIDKSLDLVKKNKFPVASYRIVSTAREAVAAAKSLKFPVVMKIVSDQHSHKTEVGGVITHLNCAEEVRSAFTRLAKISKRVMVQKQIKGVELIIGIKEDQTFGRVILFGLGGIYVEAMKDVSFRVCPISKKDASEMIKETKGSRILMGFRGKNYNLEAIESLLVDLSNLADKNEIREMDLNPVIVDDKNVWIVDARIDLAG